VQFPLHNRNDRNRPVCSRFSPPTHTGLTRRTTPRESPSAWLGSFANTCSPLSSTASPRPRSSSQTRCSRPCPSSRAAHLNRAPARRTPPRDLPHWPASSAILIATWCARRPQAVPAGPIRPQAARSCAGREASSRRRSRASPRSRRPGARAPRERKEPQPPEATGALMLRTGGVLLSQALAGQVPSALRGLTALFGMGRGVSPSP
jgi:hypothetical protein